MKWWAYVAIVTSVIVLITTGSSAAMARGFSAAPHAGGHFGDHRAFGGHFGDHRAFAGHRHFERFDGHRHFHHRARIFIAPFFFSAPLFVAPAPVYVPPVYWYYCPSYGTYYPYVSSCPEPWVPVPAQ